MNNDSTEKWQSYAVRGSYLIERLPDEGDPQRSREEMIARNVALVAYVGAWCT